jgi:hypothetical protein
MSSAVLRTWGWALFLIMIRLVTVGSLDSSPIFFTFHSDHVRLSQPSCSTLVSFSCQNLSIGLRIHRNQFTLAGFTLV